MAKPQTSSRVVKSIPTIKNRTKKNPGIDTTFKLAVSFVDNEGEIQVPLATSGGDCRIVKTSQKTSKKIISWISERIDALPDLPDPDTGDKNDVLVNKTITPVSADFLPNGISRLYSISGVYEYVLRSPTSEMNVPKNSLDIDGNKEKITSKNYKDLI